MARNARSGIVSALIVLALNLGDPVDAAAHGSISPFVHDRLQRILDWAATGQHDRALSAIEQLSARVIAGSAEDRLVTQHWAALLLEDDRLEAARSQLERAIGASPGAASAGLRFQLGTVEALLGDLAAADGALSAWLELQPDPAPQDVFFAGYVRFNRQDYAGASALMARAIGQAGAVPAAWIEIQVVALVRAGFTRAARRLLAERIAAHPAEGRWWRILASVALEEDLVEEAAVSLAVQEFIDLLDLTETARLADLLAASGQPERAARLYGAALSRSTDASPEEHLGRQVKLARLWLAAREWERAERILRQAAERTSSAEPLILLSQVYLHWERYALALEALETASARDDSNQAAGEIAWLQAVAAWNLDRFDAAREALLTARESPTYRVRAGRLLEQLPAR